MLVGVPSAVARDRGADLLALYDRAVGEVYGYLIARCRNRDVAEDVTAEVFMAAVEAVQRDAVDEVSTAWLIGIARHKLVDHWRGAEREARRVHAVADDPAIAGRRDDDPWDVHVDVLARARHAGAARRPPSLRVDLAVPRRSARGRRR